MTDQKPDFFMHPSDFVTLGLHRTYKVQGKFRQYVFQKCSSLWYKKK